MNLDQAAQLCEKHAQDISEHLDGGAVQILASWVEDGETRTIISGSGNWNARMGMAHRMIEKDKAELLANELRGIIEPPDDSEQWKKD